MSTMVDAYQVSLRASGSNEAALGLLGVAWQYLEVAEATSAAAMWGLPGEGARNALRDRMVLLANNHQERWQQDPYAVCTEWEETRNVFWAAKAEAAAADEGAAARVQHAISLAEDLEQGVVEAVKTGLTVGAMVALVAVAIVLYKVTS